MTGAPPEAAATITATPAPSSMFRSRPPMIEWRGASSIRDSQRSITPMAPDVVHSIAMSAIAISSGELSRVPVTSDLMSACTASGRKRLIWSATSMADSRSSSSRACSAASPSANGPSESTR